MEANDLSYAAGLIDGEGCIQIAKHRDKSCRKGYKFWLGVNVSMCDPQAVYWLKETFGGSVCIPRTKTKGGRTVYRWTITTQQAVSFLGVLTSFLKVKRKQAYIALKFGWLCYFGSRKPSEYLSAQETLYNQLREVKA